MDLLSELERSVFFLSKNLVLISSENLHSSFAGDAWSLLFFDIVCIHAVH